MEQKKKSKTKNKHPLRIPPMRCSTDLTDYTNILFVQLLGHVYIKQVFAKSAWWFLKHTAEK